jgi:hypothetical protein
LAIKLSNADHKKLDALLKGILDAHASGEATQSEAISALAHVFTAAAIDNEGEVRSWLERPGVLAQWKKDIAGNRP